jgi:(S)-2-hydroxyglutarate dehydrogenase
MPGLPAPGHGGAWPSLPSFLDTPVFPIWQPGATIPRMSAPYDVIVIGGGIVGLASAYQIQARFPRLRILLLEKEDRLAAHQTGRNSGVIHSGLYYKPGSDKAKNCVEGRRALVAFAQEHRIPHDVCGKLVVATAEAERPHLEKIFERGLQNEVEGLEKVGPERIREIEPHCAGVAALWVPCTGIIDFRATTETLARLLPALNAGSRVLLGHEVWGIERGEAQSTVHTPRGSFAGRRLVFCGGLQSDRLAALDGARDLDMRIVGFRGDYYDLTEKGRHKVRNLIYPVPNPAFPFLGVHFTRMTDGSVECGPNAVFVFKREGYHKLSFSLRDTWDALSYAGTWRLFRKHWRFGLDEYKRAFSKKLFLHQLRRLIPSLELDDITPGRCGVRAMALAPDGEMIDDFRIEYRQRSIHVLNAPSPAATSALSIGAAVRDMAARHFQLEA